MQAISFWRNGSKSLWPSKTLFCSDSFSFGFILNPSYPANPPLFTYIYLPVDSQQLIQTCAITVRHVYRALLPIRMLQIELYQPGRGRSGHEISISFNPQAIAIQQAGWSVLSATTKYHAEHISQVYLQDLFARPCSHSFFR